jgi:hypothetical protein
MKDREWCKRIEDEIDGLKNHIAKLGGGSGKVSQIGKIIELDINWPEADIEGLHFNAQKTRGIFDIKEDGIYYSRDILFLSARDTDDGTGRDLLSEYLDSEAVRDAFLTAIENYTAYTDTIKVFLSEKNQGIKKYNGVTCWYWLRPQRRPRSSGSAAYFCISALGGRADNANASAVGGCAPAFRVGENRHG